MSRKPALAASEGRMPVANVRRRGMGSPEPWAACSCSSHDAPDEEIAAGVIDVLDLDRGGGRE